jgi:hypothetical protein
MRALLMAGDLVEGTVSDDTTVTAENKRTGAQESTSGGHRLANIRELLAKTLDAVEVDDTATILLEGALAEGFGNDSSNVLSSPSCPAMPPPRVNSTPVTSLARSLTRCRPTPHWLRMTSYSVPTRPYLRP